MEVVNVINADWNENEVEMDVLVRFTLVGLCVALTALVAPQL